MAQKAGETYLHNIINPEVMADMVKAKIDKKLKMLPYAKIDNTLEGIPGDTITVPRWTHIGEAVDVPEGEPIPIREMGATTEKYTIKKAGLGVNITDEAVLSGKGKPVGQATTQLAEGIYSKNDSDIKEEFYKAQTAIGFNSQIGYKNIIKAIDAFNEEENSSKVLFIHPKQVTDLRLDNDFINADKYNNNLLLYGEIGMIANARVVPSKKVKYEGGQWHDILVKLNNDAETEDDLPAITFYTKRGVNLETERKSSERKTEITVDRMYVAALTNTAKVVILKCTDGASVAPLVINYNKATYKYPYGGSTYNVPAIGYNFTSKAGTTPIDYEINVVGEIPPIPNATKVGLGYNDSVTNIFIALIEVQTYGEKFDIAKLKYSSGSSAVAAVTADDVFTYAGKTYMINCWGVYDVGSGVIANYKESADDRNIINIEYNGVARKYKYTYTGAELAV